MLALERKNLDLLCLMLGSDIHGLCNAGRDISNTRNLDSKLKVKNEGYKIPGDFLISTCQKFGKPGFQLAVRNSDRTA